MNDEGHYITELILRETEADVSRVYRQAVEETQKKLDDYLQRFQVKDTIKREQLASGIITKQEYNYWRTGQIMIGKRWEEMRDTLAQDYHNANGIARSIVIGHTPDVYAVNHNYATFQIEKESMVNTSYTLYDRHTVERIIRDQPDLLPPPGESMNKTFAQFDLYKAGESVNLTKEQKKAFNKLIAEKKDIRWQKGQIQSVMTQAILQGESIPKISRRIAQTMGELNRKSTIRYARTAMTGAQNAGRVDAYKRAQDMGIDLEQQWLAIHDMRTRHEHRQLDGEHVPVGEPFKIDGYEIRFPGDPVAPGYLIWNCRCTLVPKIKEVDLELPYNKELNGMTYEEWKNQLSKEPSFEAEVPSLQVQIGRAASVDDINEIMNNQGWFKETVSYDWHQNKDTMKWEKKEKRTQTLTDLTGVDLESAKSIASSYQQVFEKFPKLAGKFEAPNAQPKDMDDKTYAWCYIRSGGKVQVNPNHYNDWAKITKSYESDVLTNWHPRGTTAESIVTHEIGHAIDGLIAQSGILGGYTKSGEFRYASSSMKTTVMKRAAKIDPNIEAAALWSTDNAVAEGVSRYATKNPQEWFAECFAEYITSANPRVVASEFGKELERLVDKLS